MHHSNQLAARSWLCCFGCSPVSNLYLRMLSPFLMPKSASKPKTWHHYFYTLSIDYCLGCRCCKIACFPGACSSISFLCWCRGRGRTPSTGCTRMRSSWRTDWTSVNSSLSRLYQNWLDFDRIWEVLISLEAVRTLFWLPPHPTGPLSISWTIRALARTGLRASLSRNLNRFRTAHQCSLK